MLRSAGRASTKTVLARYADQTGWGDSLDSGYLVGGSDSKDYSVLVSILRYLF